ncbi:MAG: hypothetical protein QE263_08625 [Vampirovibrionales bacterium]|nr:hypothetical protein [Vampirovibrionales bacterium]
MVADSTTIRFKSNAQLGQFNAGATRFNQRLTPAIADSITFSHQNAAAQAAPQFGIRRRDFLKNSLLAIGALATPTILTNCTKEPKEINNTIDNVNSWADAIDKQVVTITQGSNGTVSSVLDIAFKEGVTINGVGGPATLSNKYTTLVDGEYKTLTDTITVGVEITDTGLRITNPTSVFTKGSKLMFAAPGEAQPRGGVPQEFAIGKDIPGVISPEEYSRFTAHYTVGNLNGSAKEVHPDAPHSRNDIEDYSVTNDPAYNDTLANYLQTKLTEAKIPNDKKANLLAALNNANFNEATNNNPQLAALAIAMAAYDPTDETLNALTGSGGVPRIFFTTGHVGSNVATTLTTLHGEQAYKIAVSDKFLKAPAFTGGAILYANEVMEMSLTNVKSSKLAQVCQAAAQNYIYRKYLAALPLEKAKQVYELTHTDVKQLNLNLFAEAGSSTSLDRRLANSVNKQIHGTGSVFLLDESYRGSVYRAYQNNTTYPDIQTLPVTPPMITFMTKELGIKKSDIPTQYNEAFLALLLKGIAAKDSELGGWKRFGEVAQLSPIITL